MNKQIWGSLSPEQLNSALPLYVQGDRNPRQAKARFVISHPSQTRGEEQRAHVAGTAGMSFLPELLPFVRNHTLLYENRNAQVPQEIPTVPRIHIIGLGDVGIHCALGLRLLGKTDIHIGLFARQFETAEGLSMELNQCVPPDPNCPMPEVFAVKSDDLLACDALVFAAAAGVPKTLQPGDDVRMMQFQANKEILHHYLERIRNEGFQGTLFILSDPVDALCAFAAQKLEEILPRERILGLGLGVMAARAAFYAKDLAPEYFTEGKAYGPHGEGLWIANSLENYDDQISSELTRLAKTANLAIRGKGQKPFYGPSISSGAYSLLAWARQEWFYASVALSDVYFGCRIRRTGEHLLLEYNHVPNPLASRLDETITLLRRQR